MPPAVHALFGSTPIPRYVQLAELFRQRVEKGDWPPGCVLPSIEQLMLEYDVARVTVRQAVSLLAGEGILSPERGRGTFVTQKAGRRRQLAVETTLAELVDMYRGDRPFHATLSEGYAMPRLKDSDGVPAAKYFHMRRVHSRDGEPYCVISLFIESRVFRRAPTRFRKELVLPVLTSLPDIAIASGRQTLTISKADPETAGLLGIPVGAPIADVRRILCGPDNSVIYMAEVSYRGDCIQLDMDLKA